jgi:hypothetical protein
MANMSIQVQNRNANARFTVRSLTTHREEVIRGLLAHNAYLPVGFRIDEATLRAFLDWLGATMTHKTEAMVAAEMNYVNEQADDPAVRTRRDKAMEPVLTALSRLRVRVGSVLGDEGMNTYGLRKQVPRLAGDLADYATVVVTLLRGRSRTVDDGLGGVLDTLILANALEEALKPLREALDDIETEQRELEGAMFRRDELVGEWHEVYQGGATTVTGLYRMAGQLALSQRVKPTSRRSAGEEPPPADGTPVVVPDPDEPVEDEPIAVAPART